MMRFWGFRCFNITLLFTFYSLRCKNLLNQKNIRGLFLYHAKKHNVKVSPRLFMQQLTSILFSYMSEFLIKAVFGVVFRGEK